MLQTRHDFGDFHWLDVTGPTRKELAELAVRYKLHPQAVEDCLQPEHLPKYEEFDDVQFLILRAYDEKSADDADRVQELTRKVAVFFAEEGGQRFILTVHRQSLPFLVTLLEKYTGKTDAKFSRVMTDILGGAIHTYDKPVMDCLNQLDDIEEEVFGKGRRRKFKLRRGYLLKRKASVFKRMLRASIEPLNSSMSESMNSHSFRNVREHIDNIYFYADEVTDTVESLLNLHISLSSQKTNEASHRTNEVMRVLTIFSIFFLPINFIASVYGMNFEFMPELKEYYGYPVVLGTMLAVVAGIYLWIRRKGWLK